MAKLKSSKILAGFLALLMIVSMLPLGSLATVFAAGIDSYSVALTDGVDVLDLDDVEITLTNKEDNTKTETAKTVDGIALFSNFVEEGATYTVSVAEAIGYNEVADSEITVAVGETETKITLTAIEKITVSGVVLDENDTPYEGATVSVTGYITTQAVTNENGEYSFETYAGKSNNITVTAKSADEKYLTIPATATYNADTNDADYKFAVKTYNIDTTAGENGTITADEADVLFGSDRVISITADNGYRIEKVMVNGVEASKAANEKTFDLQLSDIREDYNISVSFYRMTYKITFTVKENGEVTYGDGDSDKVAGGSVLVEKSFDESTDPDNPTTVVVTAKPSANYRVSKVIIDGSEKEFNENDYIYTTTAHNADLVMTQDHTFVVEFSVNKYNVTLDAVTNGSATLSTFENISASEVTVEHGKNVFVVATPADGYELGEIKIGDTPVEFIETVNGYETEGTAITSDTTVYVTFVEKTDFADDSYKIELPAENGTVSGVTYVADGATVKFIAQGEYKRVRINGELKFSGSTVSLKVGKNGQVERITSIEVTKKNAGGWTKKQDLNITYDDLKPAVSEIVNSGDWHNETTRYSFTASDEESGIKEVKYASKDDIASAQAITPVDGEYSFEVSDEFNGKYYIWVVDCCGNTLNTTADVNIDLKNPAIKEFSFSTSDNSLIEDLINFASFGTVCKEKMYVTVTAADEEISSGLKEISLYYGSELLETKAVSEGKATFELTEDDFGHKTEIYAVVKDIAGNASSETKPTDTGVVTNAKSSEVQIADAAPTVEIKNADGYKDEANRIWYNGNVEFTVDVNEPVTGIKSVEIKMNGKDLIADINGVDLNEDFSKRGNPVYSASFTVSTEQNALDGKNTIEVVATSVSGVKSVVYTKDVYIDTTKPGIAGFEISKANNNPLDKVLNFLTFGIFYNEQVVITVTADDENASSGVDKITLFVGEDEYTEEVSQGNVATFTIPADEVAENSVFAADISAIAIDNVGNETENAVLPTDVNSNIKHTNLMIEKVDPTAIIEPTTDAVDGKNEATADNNKWYADDVTFKVSVADSDSGIRDVEIKINDKIVEEEIFYDPSDEQTGTDSFCDSKIYEVTTADSRVERAADGSYKVKATVTDNAGNVFTTEEYVIYKDIDAPYITKFDFVPANYVEKDENVVDNDGNALVISTDYGFYFKEDTQVIIHADDIAPTSGIKTITVYLKDVVENKLYTVAEDGTLLEIESAEEAKAYDVDANNQFKITIPADFKGQIYAKATDNVNRITDTFVNPNSAIVESSDKHQSEEHIAFEKPETTYTTNDNTELYSDDVDVTVTVTDTYSGIRDIEWSVVAPYDTDNNQSGKVTVNNDTTLVEEKDKDLSSTTWEKTQTEINLVTEMQKIIKVKNNSNNIILNVKMTDRAGNTSEESIEFSIDKTNPKIEIVYSDDEVNDEEYKKFFSTKREAVITITERNFRASDIVYAITNTDKTIPNVNLKAAKTWTTTEDKNDPDKTVHVAKVKYTVDGDYTFDISYKDNAERKANTIKQHQFTIDLTKPVVAVTYDNNSALNGNYYKADRIATITINEHNFIAKRVNVIGVATDNGENSVFPAISKWKNSGKDTYIATIAYDADSKYTFDIEFTDKAGNKIDDYTAEEFYVDKTAPDISISGVADKSANNGTVAPVITYSDTNFNKDTVSISLSGANNGKVNYSASYSNIENGQRYTYADFEKVQKVDDIYTLTVSLTDMAGNSSESTIVFSANRFGSVYDLSGVKDIIGKYLQTEKDIVFTETNVDSLNKKGIKIKLTKNGTPTDLVEGKDYTVAVKGGNGEWSVYTYTVNKSLFADDGKYSLSVYSKDAAGNVNENIDESKKAEISFGIDKTKPVIVPIDFASGVQYAVDKKIVSIEIKDNLVLDGIKIYLNGKEIDYSVEGETYTFEIPKSASKQDVKIVAVDAAGNEEPIEIKDFLVNANIFVRWYNNTPLFIGSIVGVILIIVAVVGFILFGKKKKKN